MLKIPSEARGRTLGHGSRRFGHALTHFSSRSPRALVTKWRPWIKARDSQRVDGGWTETVLEGECAEPDCGIALKGNTCDAPTFNRCNDDRSTTTVYDFLRSWERVSSHDMKLTRSLVVSLLRSSNRTVALRSCPLWRIFFEDLISGIHHYTCWSGTDNCQDGYKISKFNLRQSACCR